MRLLYIGDFCSYALFVNHYSLYSGGAINILILSGTFYARRILPWLVLTEKLKGQCHCPTYDPLTPPWNTRSHSDL